MLDSEPFTHVASTSNATLSFGTIILAAGRSRRMGRPKLLLPWGKTSVLGHLLSQWRTLGAKQIAVVRGQDDQALTSELNRFAQPVFEYIVNPAPEHGMFSSLQCAARWTGWKPDLTHFAVTLGDQPHLSRETLEAILDFSASHADKICQPRQDGHRRHPVFLPRWALERLAASTAQDFRQFLDQWKEVSAYCELADPALMLDLDSPNDYEKALALYGPR
jgi:molybdenum cofactor cytidylyltransferase